ncbi:MAG: DUF3459 domain-containing protein [Clostridiales bacterium]|nr:DUF3459 domain-containing protein [Clostridiales bacterium]
MWSEKSPGSGKLNDADSLLNTVRTLLSLRHAKEDLQADAEFEALYAERRKLPFVYRRGGLILALNPSAERVSAPVAVTGKEKKVLFSIGNGVMSNKEIALEPQSFVVWK